MRCNLAFLGVGSVLTASGHHELEASIMTDDRKCGAVALIKHVANPIVLARQVRKPQLFHSASVCKLFHPIFKLFHTISKLSHSSCKLNHLISELSHPSI